MEKQHEIALIRARCLPIEKHDVYWLFSKSQLEFVLKDVELFASPSRVPTARYRDTMLPVVSLEKYFGIAMNYENIDTKYLVVRSVNGKNEMIKLIVKTVHTLKVHKLETDFSTVTSVQFPQNEDSVLGIYSLSGNRIAVVPDIAKIAQSVQWQG